MKNQVTRGDATREVLILAALQSFARKGFSSVSTRELAEVSGVNQALIGYHFGGKEGLYLAVFEHISARVKEQVGPEIERVRRLLEQADAATGTGAAAEGREIYLPALLALVERLLSLLLNPETEPWAQLIVREQAQPTAAFDLLYDGFIAVLLGLLTQLVRRLRADEDEQSARLLVMGIVGQVIVWRMAHTGALRQLDWAALDEAKIAAIKQSVRRNVTAQLLA
ncbi:MAG: CerR family C-terminal domain-containing protein [Propionivibrio sp.]